MKQPFYHPEIPETIQVAEVAGRLCLLDENQVPLMWLDSKENLDLRSLFSCNADSAYDTLESGEKDSYLNDTL
jgi:hypothetical protein